MREVYEETGVRAEVLGMPSVQLGPEPLIGAQRGVAAWVQLARPASATLFLLIAIAFGCLTASFVGMKAYRAALKAQDWVWRA